MLRDRPKTATESTTFALADRAHQWLLDPHRGESCGEGVAGIETALYTLIGSWVCEAGLGLNTGAPATARLAAHLRARLDDADPEAAFSTLATCDSALVFVSAILLRRFGEASLHLASFSENVAALLRSEVEAGMPPIDSFVPRYLLVQAGLGTRPRATEPIDRTGWPLSLLGATREEVDAISRELTLATAFGSRRLVCPDLHEEISAVLPVWIFYYLRRYDLLMATELLRTATYVLGCRDRSVVEGLSFLAAQQLPAGNFGFLINADNLEGSGRQASLAVTLACLWTIAEARNKGFRLFRPRLLGPASRGQE